MELSWGFEASISVTTEPSLRDFVSVVLVVTIESTNENVTLESQAEATAYAVVGVPNATAKAAYDSDASILANTGAKISARVVNVKTTQPSDNSQTRIRNSTEKAWHTGGADDGEVTGDFNASETITWNADIVLLSGPDPELYVNETGKITKAIGVTVAGLAKDDFVTASEVSIDPITNQYAYEEGSFQTFNGDGNNVTINTTDTKSLKDGSVVTLIDASNPQLNSTFVIQSVVENTSFNLVGAKGINDTGTSGSWVTGGAVTFDTKTIVGDHGTISSATAFQKITLENESPKTMVLNDITVTAPSATPTVKVFAEQWNAFQFEIGHQVPPTAIDITHAPNGVTPSLILNGIINNSYGDTHLTSNGQLINSTPTMGNWASTGEKGIITRTLDVNTQAAAGALNDSLRVDLVRTTGNTDFELSAADGIYLDLGSRYIGTDSTQAIFEGGTIETSSDNADLDLFIRSTTQDLPSSPSSSNSAPVNFFVNNVSTPLSVNQLSFPTYTNHPIAGTYEFKNLIAGSLNGNVDIVSENNSDGDANKIVHFHSGIDIGKQGELFASSNGNLSLFEANDDLRIRNVTSSFGDVLLAAEGVDGSIYDLDTTETSPYGVTAWVTGNSVTLQTRHGGIGTDDDGRSWVVERMNKSRSALSLLVSMVPPSKMACVESVPMYRLPKSR